MIRMGLWTLPEKLINILGGYKHEVLHVNGPHDRQLQDLTKVLSSEFRKQNSENSFYGSKVNKNGHKIQVIGHQ